MKLFSKVAYHFTTNKGLKEFKPKTEETDALTGEGAMVHGWVIFNYKDLTIIGEEK